MYTDCTMDLREQGRLLRQWRRDRGMRREALALRLGVTAEWLRRIEMGAEPSTTLRLLIAEVTGIGKDAA